MASDAEEASVEGPAKTNGGGALAVLAAAAGAGRAACACLMVEG